MNSPVLIDDSFLIDQLFLDHFLRSFIKGRPLPYALQLHFLFYKHDDKDNLFNKNSTQLDAYSRHVLQSPPTFRLVQPFDYTRFKKHTPVSLRFFTVGEPSSTYCTCNFLEPECFSFIVTCQNKTKKSECSV